MTRYDVIIVGTGPAGMGCAFELLEKWPGVSILMLDREKVCTGGLRNDCKMNFTFPVGFPLDSWTREEAEACLDEVERVLEPRMLEKQNVPVYKNRAEKLGVELLEIRQTHLGTDGGLKLIGELLRRLEEAGVTIALEEELIEADPTNRTARTSRRTLGYEHLVVAPGRKGFRFLQGFMDALEIPYEDYIVDIGIRVETRQEHYPIVEDYYDPKFLFPESVRTFCTNSGSAHVVQERYSASDGTVFYSVNGHAWSEARRRNGLVNFAMLRTVRLTEPVASGQRFAEVLGVQAMHLGGGKPMMQRVGDFRLGKRSKEATFNEDLYDFEPTLKSCSPGDIGLAVPSKILRDIWKSLKMLDTIVPGVLHPSTIMYYPEIKLYANKPRFLDAHFRAADGVYLIGDGAGTSRGITAAWAGGIRAARGITGTLGRK